MLHFTPSETKIRNKSTERKLDDIREVVEDPAFKTAMGDGIDDFMYVLDHAYVPNVQHGRITVPRKHVGKLSLPVVSLYPGEQLSAGPDVLDMHSVQEQRLLEYARHFHPGQSDDEILARFRKLFSQASDDFAIPEGAEAAVGTLLGTFSFSDPSKKTEFERDVRSRPVTLLPVSDPHYNVLHGVHEVEHVIQGLDSPVKKADPLRARAESFRNELLAYNTQATAAMALYKHSKNRKYAGNDRLLQANEQAIFLDQLRKDTNKGKKDPFDPNGTLRNALNSQAGFDFD